ncbi:MAG TPA: PIG-L deacetylase family protein [Acidimicrobiales bacterium]|nr:PIG-L deacetylase family protein [Acidimicrobiales bacterium]
MESNSLIASAGQHLVVVVAHPDDETFGCGSLIVHAAAAGARVTVVCATRGEAGERVTDPATDHLPIGDVREQELRDAAAVLGVDAIELLHYADSGWDGELAEGALCAVAIDDLADDLDARLAYLAPDVVLVLDGGDGHRDHHHIRQAVEAVSARRAAPLPLVRACLSNSLMRRWVEEMRAGQFESVYLDLDVDSLGTPDSQLTAIDVSQHLTLREQAIACHRSQSSPYDGLSPELRRAFLATDFIQHSTTEYMRPIRQQGE